MIPITYVLALVAMFVIIGGIGLVWILRRASGSDQSLSYSSLTSPTPSYEIPSSSTEFRMTVADVFSIKGRGLVVTGRVEAGSLSVGQRVRLTSPDGMQQHETEVTGIEAFHQMKKRADVGENVGLLLAGLTKDQVKQGMIVTLA